MAMSPNVKDRERDKFEVDPDDGGTNVRVTIKEGGGGSGTTEALAIQSDSTSTPTVTYIGQAQPGTLTSAASWQIIRYTITNGNVSGQYADGNSTFDNIWDNRTALVYS